MKVTDEMRVAFDAAIRRPAHIEMEDAELDACLTAVLAIAKRDLRRSIAEEIAVAIEAQEGRAKAAHYKAALAKAARIARNHGDGVTEAKPTESGS